MKLLIKYGPMLLMLLLLSCEKEIRFKQSVSEPMMVLESVVVPDSTMRVCLTRSRFFLDNTDRFTRVSDATLQLFVNDVATEQLTYDDEGWYQAAYVPRSGDRLRLQAESPSLPAIHAEETVVTGVAALLTGDSTSSYTAYQVSDYEYYTYDTLTYIVINRPDAYDYVIVPTSRMPGDVAGLECRDYRYRVEFVFQDKAGSADYYELSLQTDYNAGTNDQPDFFTGGNNFFAGAIMTMESRSLRTSNYYLNLDEDEEGDGILSFTNTATRRFSDDFFDGEEVRICLVLHLYDYDLIDGDGRRIPISEGTQLRLGVTLSSLSENYYLFRESRASASNDDLVGIFSEPVQVYSNITGGAGILGSICDRSAERLLTTPNFDRRVYDPNRFIYF